MSDQQKIRMLNTSDAAEFARHLARNVSADDSSLVSISSPLSRSYIVDEAISIDTSLKCWNKAVESLGWTRTWGIFSGEKIVGEASFSNSRLIETQRHRAILSLGIEREFRGQGLGSLLLSKALNWAARQQALAWIDLGVFSHNAHARHLYNKFGFIEVGRVIDSFRIDDFRVDDILMSLELSQYIPKFIGSFVQPQLLSDRIILEPIAEAHAEEIWALFSDPLLHLFVPQELVPLEKIRERCMRWSSRRSSDSRELWLNWAARHRDTGQVIAHFQVGVNASHDEVATIGYLVSRTYQQQGYASEGLTAVFKFLRDQLGISEVKAWSDTRNLASHRLAEKLGMVKVDLIKDADFFKGSSSDEYVFSKRL